MAQYMENRLVWLIGLILILTFINVAEIVFATSDERELLSFDKNDMSFVIEKQELNRLLQNGEIGYIEYFDRYGELLNKYDPSQEAIDYTEFGQESTGFNVFSIFSIDIEGAPYYILLVLSIINTVIITITGFIIASYVYDFVKALPLT